MDIKEKKLIQMVQLTNYWNSSKVTKERDEWLDAKVFEIMKDCTIRKLNCWEYNKGQKAFIMKHPEPFNPLVLKSQLHFACDALGVFGDFTGPHDGIKLSQSINRLTDAGRFIKEKKGRAVRVALAGDIGYKPYFS